MKKISNLLFIFVIPRPLFFSNLISLCKSIVVGEKPALSPTSVASVSSNSVSELRKPTEDAKFIIQHWRCRKAQI